MGESIMSNFADELKNVNINSNVNDLWEIYKKEHNKSFGDPEEENRRFQIFVETVKTIIEHNAKHERGEVTFKMGINAFSHLLPEERPGGYKKPA
ncbi:crustapain-like isoform X1 [Bradysia coprophila]|uniref:crustapain-like isoform X1 n=1 Tax=Bradysia coprophila TaxID=38358 RepID=UPI00187DD7E9|nr:crustapain-like isoform X1 [Bradysia coprophila]